MTTIDRIGTINVVRHGAVIILIDRRNGSDTETFTSYRAARDRALERADLVDGLAALTRH